MFSRTIVIDAHGKKYEVEVPDTIISLRRHTARVRSQNLPIDVERPQSLKLLVFLPTHLRHIYKKDELYTPGFAAKNKHLTLTVGELTYVAVDQVEVKSWDEAREVEFLARGAPWLIVQENSINGKHIVN